MRVRKTTRPGDPQAARERALRLLQLRPHAEKELADKLKRRGFEPAIVDELIEKLRGIGLLNDEAYAAAFARSKLSAKPLGGRLLAAKLQARGIGRQLAGATADAAMAERDETALAAEAARRFLRAHPAVAESLARRTVRFSPELAKARQKLYAFLARQGFGSAIVSRAVRAAGLSDAED